MLKTSAFIFFVLFFIFTSNSYASITFTLSNAQTNGDETTLNVSISGLTSSSCLENKCYLQTAYTQEGKNSYLGYTKNSNGQWSKYISSPEIDDITSNFFSFEPSDGSWNGQLVVRVDPEDSSYKGPGNYEIRAWRYSGKSKKYTAYSDNNLTVSLNVSAPAIPEVTPEEASGQNNQDLSQKTNLTTSSTKSSAKPTSATQTKNSSTDQILSSKQEASAEPINLDITSKISPTPTPQAEVASQSKTAGIVIAAGAILIVVSATGLLWYKWEIKKTGSEENL